MIFWVVLHSVDILLIHDIYIFTYVFFSVSKIKQISGNVLEVNSGYKKLCELSTGLLVLPNL